MAFSSFIMSSRKVLINGVTYIRSRDAARTVNLAADYVSRLSRQGAIAGERVAGIWFIELGSLHAFMVEQERQKEIWYARFSPAAPEFHSERQPSPARYGGWHRTDIHRPVARSDDGASPKIRELSLHRFACTAHPKSVTRPASTLRALPVRNP